jgi:PKD repeat protein
MKSSFAMFLNLRKNKCLEVAVRDSDYVNWKKTGHTMLIFFLLFIFTVTHLFATAPNADFNVDNTTPVIGQTVTFTDASTNNPTAWSWNFGAGASPGTANTQGPHNVYYTTTGLKTASLTVSNSNGNDTRTRTDYINVSSTPVPTAGNNGPVCAGTTLSLTASTITGATYAWTGPNGFTSSSQNPTVSTSATTAMAGTYYVTATLYGYTSTAGTTDVTVNALPTCTISGSDAVCAGSSGNSYAGPGSMTSYSWSITAGTGTIVGSSTTQSVNVTAGTGSSFTLSLAINNGTCNNTCQKVVTINPIPVPIVSDISDVSCYGGNDGTITISASGGTDPYQFSIDNGSNYVDGDYPDSHTFTELSAGVPYEIRVKDVNQCESLEIP